MLTYEKCVELRDAGFPQPAPEIGQHWYLNGRHCIVVYAKSTNHPDEVSLAEVGVVGVFSRHNKHDFAVRSKPPFPQIFFAPVVEDFMGMLSPLCGVARRFNALGQGYFVLIDNQTRGDLYEDADLCTMLSKAFIDRPYLF